MKLTIEKTDNTNAYPLWPRAAYHAAAADARPLGAELQHEVLDLIEAVEVICDEDGFGLDRAREIAAKLKMEIKGVH